MRKQYEQIRNEVKEISDIFKKKMIKDCDLTDEDPDLIVLVVRVAKLLKASDKFMETCIEAMENQNEKLDKILEKLK